MRALGLCVLFLMGCSSNKIIDTDGGDDSGVKPDTGVDAAKDSGGGMDAGSDAAKLDGYYAWGHPGALNRLYIYWADAQNDVCLRLYFTSPGTNLTAVTVPNGWNLETIGTGAVHSAQACNPYYMGAAENLQNLSSSGMVNWSGTNVPGTVWTLDVTLNFAPSTWAPSSQQMLATNLNVQMF